MSHFAQWKYAYRFPLCKRGIEGDFRIAASILLLTLTSLPQATQAAELGRLFYTPQQRQQMDYQLANGTEEEGNRNYIVVNGVVQKQGGKRTVWVNGAEQADGPSAGRNPATAAVTPPGKSGAIILKVGDKLLLDTPVAEPQVSEPARPATENGR
jgi:hypothetical protein